MFTARAFARLFSVAAAVATVTLPLTTAHAQTNLGVANDYNVFVFGDHTQSGTDTEGRVAVGGNANYDNGNAGMTIASRRGGSTTNNLVVGGNYTNRYNSVNGNTVVGGNTTWLGPSQNGNIATNGALSFTGGGGSVSGSITYGTSISGPSYLTGKATQGTTALPVDFVAAQTSLSSLSDSLAAYASNGTTSVYYGGITLTGTDASLNVFTLNASQLNGATGLNINATAGSTVVVNVIGSSATFTGFGMNVNGTDKQNVLFNFNNATQVNLTNFGFNGSILATKAAVSTTYGQLNGTLIANSLSGSMESHDYTFKGNLGNVGGGSSVAVPEASTASLLLTALLAGVPAFGIVATRRKK